MGAEDPDDDATIVASDVFCKNHHQGLIAYCGDPYSIQLYDQTSWEWKISCIIQAEAKQSGRGEAMAVHLLFNIF